MRSTNYLRRGQRTIAERSNYDTVWLKSLETELASEGYSTSARASHFSYAYLE